MINWFGHAFAHMPQPTQAALSIQAGQMHHLADVVRRLADESTVPVVMHLDHGITNNSGHTRIGNYQALRPISIYGYEHGKIDFNRADITLHNDLDSSVTGIEAVSYTHLPVCALCGCDYFRPAGR